MMMLIIKNDDTTMRQYMVIIKKIYLFLYIYIHDGIYMTIKQIPVSMAREKLRRMSLKKRWHVH